MFSLQFVGLLATVAALPPKQDDSPAIVHYNATAQLYDLTLDARSSDIACRWGLWPQWTKSWTGSNKAIPAYSVAANDIERYNHVGELAFECADLRPAVEMSETEVAVRGTFRQSCGEDDVVQRFPIVFMFDSGDHGWNNLNYHRQYCAKIVHDYDIMFVPQGANLCWFVRVMDYEHQVLTIDVTAAYSSDKTQLVQNYVSVTEAVDSKTVPPLEIRVFTSSYSVKIEPSKLYHICVYNYWQAGDPADLHPVRQDLAARIVSSVDQLQ